MLCTLAILISMSVCYMVMPAAAADAYFQLTAENPNLYVNTNQKIEFVDVSVTVNGVAVNGKDLTWTAEDATNVEIAADSFTVKKTGIFFLNVEDAAGNTARIPVAVKNEADTEFVLYDDDFSSYADGTLPDGWTVITNADVTTDSAMQHATYVETPQVKNGVFYTGNGVANKDTIVLLPAYLDTFTNYAVDMDFKQSHMYNNLRFCGILVRAQREEVDGAMKMTASYYTLARRAATGSGGLEICSSPAVPGCSHKTAKMGYPNNCGPTKNGGAVTDWSSTAYNMHMTTAIQDMTVTMDLYRHADQPHFESDTATTTDGYKGSVPSPALQKKIPGELDEKPWSVQLKKGGVGLRGTGCQMAVSHITVTVPTTMIGSNPNYYVPSSEANPDAAVFEDLKIGIISDVHIHPEPTPAEENLRLILNMYKEKNVDIVVVPGDIANTGLQVEYDRFNAIWDEVFPDPSTAPIKFCTTGNHEFEQAYYHRMTVEEVYDRFMASFGYDTLNRNVKVKGYHFIGLNSENASVHGKYTSVTTDWLRAQLDAAVAENPYMPIFVANHQTLPETTYGSHWGSSGTKEIKDVLKDYPQVVFIAGHSHYAMDNERCIYQKDFTCLDVTSLQYLSVEAGTPDERWQSQGGLLATISGTDKTLTIDRYRCKDLSKPCKDAWVLPLPLAKDTFKYTDARKELRNAPVFPDGAAITVSDIKTGSCQVTFPSATHEDYVQGYEVKILDADTREEISSKYFVSDFYLDLNNMKKTQTTKIAGMNPNTKYIVEAYAVESFGKKSTPISATFSTAPVTTPSDAINRADFLDVNFIKGFMDNSPYRSEYTLYGSGNKSKLIHSEEINRQVLQACGWINYPTTNGMTKKISETMMLETAFKIPDGRDGTQCLGGNLQSGGMGIEITKTGTMTAYLGLPAGGYTKLITQVEPNKWYHVVVTYDKNSKAVMYVNGEEVASAETNGNIIKYNPDMRWMSIGANTQGDGNGIYTFKGEMALFRIYTKAGTAADAKNLYTRYQNDPAYEAVYDNMQILKNLDLTNSALSADYVARVQKHIADGQAYIDGYTLTPEQSTAYVVTAQALLKEYSDADPSILWQKFTDPCENWAFLQDHSENWQKDKQPALDDSKFFTKNQNVDTYLTYKVDGPIRNFKIDSMVYAGFGDMARDVDVFVSEDGQNWKKVAITCTDPVAHPAYEPGEAVAWQVSTGSATENLTGQDTYLKIVLKKFENGVNWSLGIDNVTILYTDEVEPENPSEPETSEPETSEPETSEPETSKPDASNPDSGAARTAAPILFLALTAGAAITLTARKRKNR